jgi:hypothetical protein
MKGKVYDTNGMLEEKKERNGYASEKVERLRAKEDG